MTFTVPRPRPAPDTPEALGAPKLPEIQNKWYAQPARTAAWAPGAPEPWGGPDGADALEVPEQAGRALLRRPGLSTGAVALDPTGRIQILIPSGSAEELPGLLEWLEWGGIELDLTAQSGYAPREAAVWLRPPGWGCEADLVRLVSAAATECHRTLLGCSAQPFAFS